MNKFLKSALLAVMLLLCSISFGNLISTASANTGNNDFSTATNLGKWKYSSGALTVLDPDQDEAYVKFTASAGDRVYVKSTYQSEYGDMFIELYDKNYNYIDTGYEVINPNSLTPFLYVNADATSTSNVFYAKVTRDPNYTGTMYFTVSVDNRIKSGSKEFAFFFFSTNSGNAGLDLNGVDSSVITLDLTKDTTIPKDAKVKLVSTRSSMTPSQGNVTHKIMSSHNKAWYTALASNATSGSYNISLTDDLKLSSIWSFKYNAKATAASTMKNVRANFSYEYDLTDQF